MSDLLIYILYWNTLHNKVSKSSKAAREVNGNNQLVADINDTCEKAIDRPLVTTSYYSARTMTGRTICVCVQGVCVFCSSRLWRKILRTGCPNSPVFAVALLPAGRWCRRRRRLLQQQPDMILCVNDGCVYADIWLFKGAPSRAALTKM